MKIGSTDSGGYVKFTPEYIIVGMKRVSEFFLRFQSYSFGNSDHMQSFKIVAYLLLGSTDSRGYVKFTPKYIIVGGEGGYSIFC